MKSEYQGNIEDIRAVEDSIRATKKYTKGSLRPRHEPPIQGEEFPSRLIVEHYEIYPFNEVSWDMPAGQALNWLWGEFVTCQVHFRYDYNGNKAKVSIQNGTDGVKKLAKGIPGFSDALAVVIAKRDFKSVYVHKT